MKDLENMLQETLEFYQGQEKQIIASLTALPKGRIRRKVINKDSYYYLQYRKSGNVVDEYIGKKVPEDLIKNIEKRKRLEKELKKIKEAMKTLKAKRSQGVEFIAPLRKFFTELTKHGLWEEELEIVGTWCFILYQRFLDVPHYPLSTRDLDILIPLPYKGKALDISELLKELGFNENFNPDGSMFFAGYGLKIEFLAPKKGKGKDKPEYVKSLGITPQLLRLMNILLHESTILKIGRGMNVRVPAPTAFLLHKLLVALRRDAPGKTEKDIKQAIYVGKYVLQKSEEQVKLFHLWQSFPFSWRKKARQALMKAREIVPLEEATVNALEKLLA